MPGHLSSQSCCDKPNASFRNHNAENDRSTGTLSSIQPIAEGEEILIEFAAMEWKHPDKEIFQMLGGFICTCSVCKFPRITPESRAAIPTKGTHNYKFNRVVVF